MHWSEQWQFGADYAAFTQKLKEVFDHPDQGQSSRQRMLSLHQGSSSVANYAIQFRILAKGSSWNEPALTVLFHEGLNADIQLELFYMDFNSGAVTAAEEPLKTLSMCLLLMQIITSRAEL